MTWLLSKVDLSDILEHWRETNWALLMTTAVILHVVFVVLKSIRLKIILKYYGIEKSVSWLTVIQFRGNFVKNFIPGGITGDIYKTYAIIKEGDVSQNAISTVLIEKTFGISALMLLSISSLFYGLYWLEEPVFRQIQSPVLVASGIFLVAIILICFLFKIEFVDFVFRKFNPLMKLIHSLRQITGILSNHNVLLQIVILSFLIQFALVGWYWAVAFIIKLKIPFLILLAIIPVVAILVTLPISIGGIGVRESALVILLGPFGVSMEDAVSFSMLSFIIMTVIRVFSGSAFVFNYRDQKAKRIRENPDGV